MVTFAGDTIPLDDPDIRERLEKELWINAFWHSNTSQLIRRSGYWFPIMDSLLVLEGIPTDFKYLVAIESSFENVTSNKGAVGFWQLMEPTAKELGLIVNKEMDERLNTVKSTHAAARYLKKSKSQLGNWAAVSASYNIGVQGLKNVMAVQYTDNFYDLLINAETGRYLFRALACKLILEEPEKFGFSKLKPIVPLKTRKEVINQSINDLAYWCRKNGFTYKCFRMANPWVKSNQLTISDSIAQIEVQMPIDCKVYTRLPLPEETKTDTASAEKDLIIQHSMNEKNMQALKQTKENPAAEFHIVQPGENLELISRKYNLTQNDLFLVNPGLEKRRNKIEKGLRIQLPKPAN